MKTNYLVLFILGTFLFSACNVGVKKDLLSGLKVTNSGLSYKDAYLQIGDKKITSTEFKIGDEIVLYVDGVEGYTEKDGKVYIGASLDIIDPSGKKVMDNPDLFTGYDATGLAKEQAAVITLKLTTGPPLVTGVKYVWKSKIWDKNSKSEINAELEFTIK